MNSHRNRSLHSVPSAKSQFILGIFVSVVLAMGSSQLCASERVPSSLKDLDQYSSPFNRNVELHLLLLNANEQQLLELLAESKEVDRRKRPHLQRPILQRLSQIDPNQAYAQIELLTADDPKQLIEAVFAEWSSSNLEEAVVFASSLDENSRFAALKSILFERTDLSADERRDIARQLGHERYAVNLNMQEMLSKPIDNPEETWNELVDEIKDDPGQSWALATVARAWAEKSGVRILDRVSRALNNDQTRQWVLGSVLRKVAESDPQSAFEYALKLDSSPGGFGSLVAGVTDTWIKSDPRSAFEAASQVEKLGLRRRLQDSVVRAWAYEMPRDVLSALDTLPDHLHHSATRAAIGAWVQEDPNEAADFVARMDSQSRKLAASNLVAIWSSQEDYSAALDWIQTEPRMADLKPLLLPETLMYLAYRDPTLAMETALAQPISGDAPGLEASMIFYLASKDPDEALEFLPQVRSGSTKMAAFGHLGNSYIQNGASDEAVSLAKQLPASKQTEYFQSLFTSWTRRDPDDLLDSLDQLPTEDVKSKAAVALLKEYDRRNSALYEQQAQRARKYLSAKDAESL